jgi:hypothetical protein
LNLGGGGWLSLQDAASGTTVNGNLDITSNATQLSVTNLNRALAVVAPGTVPLFGGALGTTAWA